MSKFTSSLDDIRVASPCAQNWDEMTGDERARFCGECKLHVYNLSGMSRNEAENLIFRAEGNRLCVRFFRRADGTILTRDCPVGWRAVKRRVSKTATAFASLVFTALGAIGLTNFFARSNRSETGSLVIANSVKGEISLENAKPVGEEKPIVTAGQIDREYLGGVSDSQFYTAEKMTRENRGKKKRNFVRR